MAPINDELLDKLLSRHLSSRLDGQLGGAELAFRRHLARPATAATPSPAPLRIAGGPADRSSFRRRMTSGFWFIGLAGTAAAACLATLWILPQLGSHSAGTKSVASTGPSVSAPAETVVTGSVDQPMIRYVHNQTWDEGTVTPTGPGTPMRRVRHEQVEHMQWYDAQRGAKVEMVVPRQNVELYELDTY